jgi:hypothetical protein
MIHRELSPKIIGTAIEALNELKPGFDEKPYERSRMPGLQHRERVVSEQRSFPVSHGGERLASHSGPQCNPWLIR